MSKKKECIIDTMILQKANAPLRHEPRLRARIRIRLELLTRIQRGELIVLVSERLIREYQQQIPSPRNDLIQAFFALLMRRTNDRIKWNWKKRWSGSDREKRRNCRFPQEDEHVLRTAILDNGISWIVTEEMPMLQADKCIYRAFRVHIIEPRAL